MLISLNDLPEPLRKYITELRACVKSALEDFVSICAPFRVRLSQRTEASIIHDFMTWYARERFEWVLKRNLFLVKIEDYRVKLKKLDARWRTRSIPTQLALQFEKQQQLHLFDDLDVTNLFLGYQRDAVEILKSGIWLVCPDGKGFKWVAELTTEEIGGAVEFAITPTEPTAEIEERRITAKKTAEDGAAKAVGNESNG
jgi:hypothetical protein